MGVSEAQKLLVGVAQGRYDSRYGHAKRGVLVDLEEDPEAQPNFGCDFFWGDIGWMELESSIHEGTWVKLFREDNVMNSLR